MNADQLVTMILTSAVELDTQRAHAKSRDAAMYFEGGRDTLRALAEAFQKACPLAVALFQQPVVVKEA